MDHASVTKKLYCYKLQSIANIVNSDLIDSQGCSQVVIKLAHTISLAGLLLRGPGACPPRKRKFWDLDSQIPSPALSGRVQCISGMRFQAWTYMYGPISWLCPWLLVGTTDGHSSFGHLVSLNFCDTVEPSLMTTSIKSGHFS